MTVLFSVFGMKITAYAVGIAVAAAAALAVLRLRCAKMGLRARTWDAMALLALPLGLICARLFYCFARFQYYRYDQGGLISILRGWEGGYSLWGALGGAVLAAVIAARITRQKPAPLLDALAPALAIFVALERFSEYFDSELGYGVPVTIPFFQRLPFAVYNEWWMDWMLAICLLEGMAALILFAVLLRKQRRPGDTARLFFVVYGACQILLESLREDSVPKWLFVKVYQVTALAAMLVLMIAAVVRWALNKSEARMKTWQMIVWWAVFLLLTGTVVAMEFSIDGKILAELPGAAAYGIIALCCAGMGFCACRIVLRNE